MALSYSFVKKFKDKIVWAEALKKYKIPEDAFQFITDKSLIFTLAPKWQNLSETWINENADKISWRDVVKYQKVSDSCLLKNKTHLVELFELSSEVPFSESFLDNFDQMRYSEFDWKMLKKISPELSDDFLESKVSNRSLLSYGNTTPGFGK